MNEEMRDRLEFSENEQFSGLDSAISWLCLFMGYLFCRLFPASGSPLGTVCFLLLLYFMAFVFLKLRGYCYKGLSVAVAISGMVTALIPAASGNRLLSLCAFLYSLAALGYFIYSVSGNCLRSGFGNLIFLDFFKALVITPFFRTRGLFRAMFSGKIGRKYSLRILIGIFLTILPTALVSALLSYDNDFAELWWNLFDFNLIPHIGSLILGIPLGMYLFGLYQASFHRSAEDFITADGCERAAEKIKIAPSVTVLTAALPLLFVYVMFFVSQWKYFVSGFTGVLPEGFSYADYARDGFFELCSVAVINLVVTALIMLFMNKKRNVDATVQRVLCILFSVSTLILIATALSKMSMYIEVYGLTQKRVLSSWLMGVMTVIFVLICVGQFVSRLQIGAVSLAVAVLAFAVLGLCNVDGMIARYNVKQYSCGEVASLDLMTIYELGDAGVPHLVKLANELEGKSIRTEEEDKIYDQLDKHLKIMYGHLDDERSIFTVSVPSLSAKKALNERYDKD